MKVNNIVETTDNDELDDRRLAAEAALEKLRTPNIKSLKTMDDVMQGK